MKSLIISSMAFLLFINSCQDDEMNNNSNIGGNQWLVPKDEVLDGGPGKDGIPAIDNPQFVNVAEVQYLTDNDLILGFADGEDIRAYSHPILNWHEIVNDDTQNHSIAVIYCPLTGTGIGWDRMVNNTKTTFGVSGLLYNSNIIPYDRLTDSNWSQLMMRSINGEMIGNQPNSYSLIETTWKTWRQMYPNSQVLSTNTGFNRNYGHYPYGSYRSSTHLIFPVNHTDDRLHPKERVLAVFFGNRLITFAFDLFDDNLSVVNDEFVVAGSRDLNLMVAYRRVLDGTTLEFSPIQDQLPVIMQDNEGNQWDVFGRAVSGPRQGQSLPDVTQMMGYWFAFAAFYPNLELFEP
jgi:hypothetical protein